MSRKGKPAASRRAVRLGLVGALVALLLYSTGSLGRSNQETEEDREISELEHEDGSDFEAAIDGSKGAAAAAAAAAAGQVAASTFAGKAASGAGTASAVNGTAAGDMVIQVQVGTHRKYGLPDDEVTEAVLAASQRHGEVHKAGPLPADFWTADKRAWREEVFNGIVARDMAQPRSRQYWEADATGELALKPLALPFPLCHTYVNHKYRVIFIIHPKSASTATKRYMTLCRLEQTDSCLSPLEDAAELVPLQDKWREYFVFTFIRNPWARAYSSWKFLREGFMLRPGGTGKHGKHGPPCVGGAWADYCGDPLLLGRMCLAQPHCCPGKESAHFMFYHMTDQATCLLTADGQLAVDFIGRCATPLKPRICPCPCSATALRLAPLHVTASALQPPAPRLTPAPPCLPLTRNFCPLTTVPQLLPLPCHSPRSPSWTLLCGVEHVDEDMQAAVKLINSRLLPGVPPLSLPAEVAAINIGPKRGEDRPPNNSRYLPAFQGNAAPCFAKLARFYEKDVKLMFPALYDSEQGGPAEEVEEAEDPAMADPPAR